MNVKDSRHVDVQDVLMRMGSGESRTAFELRHPGFRASWFIAAVRQLHRDDRSSLNFPVELCTTEEELIFSSSACELITRFGLAPFFIVHPDHPWGVVPAAFDFTRGIVKAEEMKQWRARYRKCSQLQQIMIATLIWLFQEKAKDTVWLRRVPCTWTLSAAAEVLSKNNSLGLWLTLIICGGAMQFHKVK